jgi:hypothetical protein
MKQSLLTLCLVAILLAGYFFRLQAEAAVIAAESVTGTPVGGPIFEDTVWDVAGSPYVMIDVVHVEPGVTLTIEPGVTIMGSSDTALAVSGYLSAVGTAVDRIIFTSALDSGPGQWWGVDIGSGGAHLEHVVIRYAGGPLVSPLNLYPLSGGEPVLLANSTLHDYAGYAVTVPADLLHRLTLDNVTFVGAGTPRVKIAYEPDWPGTPNLSADVTLSPQPGLEGYEISYHMGLFVPEGVTLNLQPGTVLMGTAGSSLAVRGHLEAIGTEMAPITFTSAADSGPGEWSGIVVLEGSAYLDHAVLRYGGAPSLGIVNLEPPAGGGPVVIANSTLHDYADYAVTVAPDLLHRLALDNVTFAGAGLPRVKLFTEYGWQNSLSESVTLRPQPGLEGYELGDAGLRIPEGITLTLQAGTVIRSPVEAHLFVHGHLEAAGTASQPVSLTSMTDAGPDRWGAIALDGGTAFLEHTAIRRGGHGPGAMVHVFGSPLPGQLQMNHTLLEQSAAAGLYVEGGQVLATCATLRHNAGGAVYVAEDGSPTVALTQTNVYGNSAWGVNNQNDVAVDARHSWWGDPSGPAGDGPGSGDAVLGNVLYTPWLAQPACSGGQSPADLILHNQIGGVSGAVAAQDGYAYLGVGPRLAILDVSDPAEPFLVGQSQPLHGPVDAFVVAGNYAYVADPLYGLAVIDVSNAAEPIRVAAQAIPGVAKGIAVGGNHAYLAMETGEVHIFDVTEPAQPLPLAVYVTFAWLNDLALVGDYLYLVWPSNALEIVDISDPASPVHSSLRFLPGTRKIVAAGDFAYVSEYQGLHILDVSTPAAPSLVSSILEPSWDVAVQDGFAFIASAAGGILVYDLADPAAPLKVAEYDGVDVAWSVALSGNHLLVSDRFFGLRVVDVAVPADPLDAGVYSTDSPQAPKSIAVTGDYLYVGSTDEQLLSLEVYDAADPLDPVLVNNVTMPYGGWGTLVIDGDTLYIANYLLGLSIYDISDRLQPVAAGHYTGPGSDGMRDVAVLGSHAYGVTFGYGVSPGLTVIDVSDPAAPAWVTTIYLQGAPQRITIAGHYAYVAGGASLRIFDLSAPDVPILVGNYEMFDSSHDVAVAGHLAYLAMSGGLLILDISDPAAPAPIGANTELDDAYRVVVSGDYVYLTTFYGPSVVAVMDVLDPANPTLLASRGLGLGAYSLAAHAGTLYVADAVTGLFIFDDAVPVEGLTAANDSPTVLGEPTFFTATISAGTNVTYAWDFGDGAVGSGATVAHTYAAVGEYTAVVTATNTAGTVTAMTTVVVTPAAQAIFPIYLPIIMRP